MEKYGLEWALKYRHEDYYDQLRRLAEERYKIIEPSCGCRVFRIKNKLVHRKKINEIEMDMRKLIGDER